MRKKDFIWLLDETVRPRQLFVTSRVPGMFSICLAGESFPRRLPNGASLMFTGKEIVIETFAGTQRSAYQRRDRYLKWFNKAREE